MKAYTYNAITFIFESEINCYLDSLTNKFIVPNNATTIAPPSYNTELEVAKFDLENQMWGIEKIKLKGKYYLKINGQYFSEILKQDLNLYTLIPIVLNEGDVIYFDDNTQAWIYNSKGEKTIQKDLEDAKKEMKDLISKTLLSIECFIENANYKTKIEINEYVKNIFVNGKNYTPFAYFMFDNNNQALNLLDAECDKVSSTLGYLIQYIRTNEIYNSIEIDKLNNITDVKNYIAKDKDGQDLIKEKVITLS